MKLTDKMADTYESVLLLAHSNAVHLNTFSSDDVLRHKMAAVGKLLPICKTTNENRTLFRTVCSMGDNIVKLENKFKSFYYSDLCYTTNTQLA